MIDDLNLSNILPWDTAETQVPINRLQLINNVVSQLPKEKNRLQQTKSIKAQLPQSITHRKVDITQIPKSTDAALYQFPPP